MALRPGRAELMRMGWPEMDSEMEDMVLEMIGAALEVSIGRIMAQSIPPEIADEINNLVEDGDLGPAESLMRKYAPSYDVIARTEADRLRIWLREIGSAASDYLHQVERSTSGARLGSPIATEQVESPYQAGAPR